MIHLKLKTRSVESCRAFEFAGWQQSAHSVGAERSLISKDTEK